MTMLRWNPSREMVRWMNLINEINGDEEVVQRTWSPRVDIVEDEHEFRVYADLPGVSKDSIDITLEDGVLTLVGTRAQREEEKDTRMHTNERVYGKFSRRFNVNDNIDGENIHATFDNGVLTLRLPKAEQAKPRKIEIDAAGK